MKTLHKKADILQELYDIRDGKTLPSRKSRCFCDLNMIRCVPKQCALLEIRSTVCNNGTKDPNLGLLAAVIRGVEESKSAVRFRTVISSQMLIKAIVALHKAK